MNERIRELITQAGGHWNYGDFNMGSSVEFQEDDLEKFAELIVRECAGIAYEYDEPKMSGSGMIIAGRIESLFGLEE